MEKDFWEIWMSIIGISMAFASIPQIYCLYREKTSKEVSLLFWFIIINGQGWWLIYGIYKKSFSLVITNAVCIILGAITIVLILKYRKYEKKAGK